LKSLSASTSPNGIEWEWWQCAQECAAFEECEFWTLRLSGNKACLLMKDAGAYNEGINHVEGTKDVDCLPPSPTVPPSASPSPTKVPTLVPSPPPTIPLGPSPKKGIGMHEPQTCNALENYDGTTWWYDWGNHPFQRGFCETPTEATSGIEFVPMFWDHRAIPSEPLSIELQETLQNAEYLLTFNEPEREDQANIPASYAAELWPRILSIANEYNLQVVAPCGTIDYGFQWYQDWINSCISMYGEPCEYDFTCLHAYYQPLPCDGIPGWACVSDVMGKINNWKNTFGKPTWVTEFACNPWEGDCDAQKQYDLMEQIVPMFEASDAVYRYAWFEAYGDSFGEANTNEIVWEHTERKTCPNKKWLAGVGSDSSWQIRTAKECLTKADQDLDCHSPTTISMDSNSCYCATDACPNLSNAWSGMHTWRQVNQRDHNVLTELGNFYQTV